MGVQTNQHRENAGNKDRMQRNQRNNNMNNMHHNHERRDSGRNDRNNDRIERNDRNDRNNERNNEMYENKGGYRVSNELFQFKFVDSFWSMKKLQNQNLKSKCLKSVKNIYIFFKLNLAKQSTHAVPTWWLS